MSDKILELMVGIFSSNPNTRAWRILIVVCAVLGVVAYFSVPPAVEAKIDRAISSNNDVISAKAAVVKQQEVIATTSQVEDQLVKSQGDTLNALKDIKSSEQSGLERTARIEGSIKSIGGRFDSMDKRFDSVDKRFDSIEQRLDNK